LLDNGAFGSPLLAATGRFGKVLPTDHGVINERERAVLIESTIRAPKGCATTSAVADWSVLLWAEVSKYLREQHPHAHRGDYTIARRVGS
jgi:hypothetical protein